MTIKFYTDESMLESRTLEEITLIDVIGETEEDAEEWRETLREYPYALPMLNMKYYNAKTDSFEWISIPIQLVMSIAM